MNRALKLLGLGKPRAANVADLEAELSALWRSATEDPETGGTVTRASALTLLVYVEDREAERRVGEIISRVTLQSPCRAIVMIAEPEASPAGLEAWVSAHCHLPVGREKQVCCEQVSVLAHGESVRDLDNVVVPLVLPGLPVFLWWCAGRFVPPDYFEQILRITSRVLVDSARFDDPEAGLVSLAGLIPQYSRDVAFGDLNWIRSLPWRELIAQCFDAADTRPYLQQLDHVRMEYEQKSPRVAAQRAQGLLLLGWMASRLGWEPDGSGGNREAGVHSFRFKSPAGPVNAELAARHYEGGGTGVCFSIKMSAQHPGPAIFSVWRGRDGKNAFTRREIAGQPLIERSARLQVLDEAELLSEEMKYPARAPAYEDALDRLAQMVASR